MKRHKHSKNSIQYTLIKLNRKDIKMTVFKINSNNKQSKKKNRLQSYLESYKTSKHRQNN